MHRHLWYGRLTAFALVVACCSSLRADDDTTPPAAPATENATTEKADAEKAANENAANENAATAIDQPVAQDAEKKDAEKKDAEKKDAEAKKLDAEKKQAKRTPQPLKKELALVFKKLAPHFKGKKVMAAAVPDPKNSAADWPAATAVLNDVLLQIEADKIDLAARVAYMELGVEQTPNKELIDELYEQFPYDLLLAADYSRTEKNIRVGIRLFDAKTRKKIAHETIDLGSDVNLLGYVENRRVWEYCHRMKGYMVGNGECWSLAASALVESSARPAWGYQYGTPVAIDGLLIPGDLFQLEGVGIRGADGLFITMGHHTSIVHNNFGGGVIEMIHQNGPPLGRYVCLLQVSLRTQASGVIMPYRPLPAGQVEAEN